MLVVLIFGSIAVFEYRKIFSHGLVQELWLEFPSSGCPLSGGKPFVAWVGFCCAVELAKLIHEFVFVLAGFDSELAALVA